MFLWNLACTDCQIVEITSLRCVPELLTNLLRKQHFSRTNCGLIFIRSIVQTFAEVSAFFKAPNGMREHSPDCAVCFVQIKTGWWEHLSLRPIREISKLLSEFGYLAGPKKKKSGVYRSFIIWKNKRFILLLFSLLCVSIEDTRNMLWVQPDRSTTSERNKRDYACMLLWRTPGEGIRQTARTTCLRFVWLKNKRESNMMMNYLTELYVVQTVFHYSDKGLIGFRGHHCHSIKHI